ncbi:MAG: DUF3857 domain-containing protein, partial [bacterium]|nr:DUF3857 domain-containing protein [bacterium]
MQRLSGFGGEGGVVVSSCLGDNQSSEPRDESEQIMDRRTSFRVYGLCLFLLTLVAPWAQADGDAVWMTYFQSRDAEAALAAFQEAVIESPTDALAWAGLSLLGESRAAIEEVSGTYFDALQHGADQPQARVFLEWALQGVTGKDSAAHAVERLDAVLGQENVPLELRDALWFAKGGLLKRLGRWDEAAAMYEQLGFVREFWLCGPFDNAEKSGHGRVFGPEESIALDESYPGKRGAVQWRPMPLLPSNGYIDLHPLITPSKEVSTYLATRLDSETARAAVLKIGHSGAVKAWLNGDLVADVDRYHALGLDQVNVPLTLGAGKNYLLLKVSSNQEGRYGVFVRVVDESQQPLAAAMLDPKTDEVSGLVPKPDVVFDDKRATEPSGFLQMKALAEGEGAKPYHFLFYSLLLDVLDLADETDPTANKILSELNTLIPNHPLILRFLGDTEKEANRKRLAYTQALEVDAKDQACFLRLLRYYRDAPYATVFLDLVRGWERGSEVPFGARLMQAQFLSKRGLNDAAIDLLRGLEGDPVAIQRLMYEFGKSAFSEEAMTQRAKGILAEDAGDLDRVHDLRRLALRAGDRAEVERLLEWEQRIAPLSISGLVDVARNEQGRGAYEASLPYIERALAVAPDDFECHRLAAIAHEALGDRERALNELAFCMKVQPSDPWCRDYAKFLQPEEENYATPYLREWQGIEVPETLDLSQANYVTLLDQRIVKVFQNGNSSETVHTASLILTDTGLRQKQVDGVYYDADTEEVRVIRARVWKQDGTFYDAPRPQKRSAASAQDAAQKLYGDYSVAVIEFPALEKGAVVELEYEKKSKGENIYADYFGDIFYAGDTALQPTVVADYVLITPTSRDFYWKMLPPHYPASVSQEGVVLQTEPEVKESGPERVYHWVFRHMPAIPQEPFMPKATEILPYIKVSTFKTWNDMTTWYWNLMKDQIVPGQPLKERLRQVLADYRKKRGYGEGQELSQW